MRRAWIKKTPEPQAGSRKRKSPACCAAALTALQGPFRQPAGGVVFPKGMAEGRGDHGFVDAAETVRGKGAAFRTGVKGLQTGPQFLTLGFQRRVPDVQRPDIPVIPTEIADTPVNKGPAGEKLRQRQVRESRPGGCSRR